MGAEMTFLAPSPVGRRTPFLGRGSALRPATAAGPLPGANMPAGLPMRPNTGEAGAGSGAAGAAAGASGTGEDDLDGVAEHAFITVGAADIGAFAISDKEPTD